MEKTQSFINSLLTKLMILICSLSILVTPLQPVYAASFEDTFRYFGEELTSWEVIEKLAAVESPSDLATDYQTLSCKYHKGEEATTVTIKVTNAHLSLAQELKTAFVNQSLWDGFKKDITGDNGPLVKVDFTTKKVSANKANGCSSAVYSQLKNTFSDVSGGTAANDFVFDVLGDNVKPEANEITDTVLSKVFVLSNTIIYIGISLISIYFALTVVADLAFLIAPAFRRYLVSVETTNDSMFLSPENHKKIKMLAGGLVSETALLSLGCRKGENNQIGINDARTIGVDFMVPDWKYFLVHKAGMWIVITIFLIIFWSGQLGQLASLVLEFMTWVYNAVLNMLRG